jgi:fructose-1,6-bisphosphatase I
VYQTSCKLISRSVRKAGIAGLYGVAGSTNTTGDDQKKLDVLSNEMMRNSLYNSHVCAILVSEEDEEPIIVPEEMAGESGHGQGVRAMSAYINVYFMYINGILLVVT